MVTLSLSNYVDMQVVVDQQEETGLEFVSLATNKVNDNKVLFVTKSPGNDYAKIKSNLCIIYQ
jgi:hypothetical protein